METRAEVMAAAGQARFAGTWPHLKYKFPSLRLMRQITVLLSAHKRSQDSGST